MSSTSPERNREGGEQQIPIHGGGVPPVDVQTEPIAGAILAEQQNIPRDNSVVAGNLKGVEHAPRIENNLGASPASSLGPGNGGAARLNFTFPSAPFLSSANSEKTPSANKENVSSAFVPSAASLVPPTTGLPAVRVDSAVASAIPFSRMSAKDLAQIAADDIRNFNSELWIAEDLSGSAIIKHIAPTALAEFLEKVLKITSAFTASRIQSIILPLVAKDLSIDAEVREQWAALQAVPSFLAGQRPAATPIQQFTPSSAFTPQNLFSTPSFGGSINPASRTPSLPAFLSRQTTNESLPHYTPPSFLRECGAPEEFSMEDTSLFANTTRASAVGLNSSIFTAGGGGMSITINQPSATPPKYVILESTSNPTAFYDWLRKNRKESLLALPVDRRTLSQLVGEDVKDEVARIIKHLGPNNSFYFNPDTCPFPKNWPEVSDHLLLKILFAMNGPRSAAEAKARLKLRLFWQNDRSTSQDKIVGKLRKFCNEFKCTLKDFAYTHYLWAVGDTLDHNMIIEAFSDCFSNVEQIKGPTGEMVPKSRCYAKIKEMIRERKSQPLEDIMHHIIDSYERVDFAVRGNKSISYDIKPWGNDDDEKKGGKKRGFNQVSGGRADHGAKKQQTARPAAEFPRCPNCGRKSHLGGERTCHLFGHPKGRGAAGTWAEGEPSLWLDKDELKAWKGTRDHIFYGYAENQKKKGGS